MEEARGCSPSLHFMLAQGHAAGAEYDMEGTALLEPQGYWVIGFWNNEVENDVNGGISVIESTLEKW